MATNQNQTKRILAAMSEQFMRPQVTRKLEWLELDGTHGVIALPVEDFPAEDVRRTQAPYGEFGVFVAYYEGTIQSATIRSGYGARLSAPGYLDATDWTVFDTQDEAEQYLVDTYGDDVEIEDEETEEN